MKIKSLLSIPISIDDSTIFISHLNGIELLTIPKSPVPHEAVENCFIFFFNFPILGHRHAFFLKFSFDVYCHLSNYFYYALTNNF